MTPLVRFVSRTTLVGSLLISMTHLAGAADGPGDGFTAGIISALGLTLQFVGQRQSDLPGWLRRAQFEYFVATGLVVALLAAVLPMVGGQPFLAPMDFRLILPLLGEIWLTRAFLLDLGIYLIVLGSAMTALDQLGLASE